MKTLCDQFDDAYEGVIDPCAIEYYEGDLYRCNQVPYFCDNKARYKENWKIPMEFCLTDSDGSCIKGAGHKTYKDSLNNFHAGKTFADLSCR